MMLDLQNLLSDSQSIAAAAGTVVCTNAIDLGAAGTIPAGFQARGGAPHDIGRAGNQTLLVQIDEAVTSAGAATVDFQLIMSANSDLSSPTVLQTTGVIGKATLVVGYQARLALPVGISARYLGVQYVIGTAATTAGKATAALVSDKQTTTV